MHVIHSLNNKKVDEHVTKEVALFSTNKKGNYLSLGEHNFSHTQGVFFFDIEKWSPYKAIEDIKLDAEMAILKNNFSNVQRVYTSGAEESFNLFNNSMLYSVKNYHGDATIEVDFRYLFDYDDKGRIYTITEEDGIIIIRYDKFSDHSLSTIDHTRFLAIKGAGEYNKIGCWLKKNYSYDGRRGSRSEFYTYTALSLKVEGSLDVVFSFSHDKEEAKSHANEVFENKTYLANSMKNYATHSFASEDLALSAAMKALDDLLVTIDGKEKRVGIFAGYPWFYQFWGRDELISLKALLLQEKYGLVKNVIFRYLNSISDEGVVPNRLPNSEVKSLDAVGWLFLRANELIQALSAKKLVDDYLTLSDFIAIKQGLEKSIQGLVHHHAEEGLVAGGLQESWMDTKNCGRKGAFIEVQALFLAMLRMHNDLAKLTNSKQLFKGIERDYKAAVKRVFFKDGCLIDSYPDEQKEARPNLFLAYYIYPDLLSKQEWKGAFDKALKELWLDWGGLSTLNQKSHSFKSEYTGESDESYHNGDSWYFVNNYAALAMHRLDKECYAKQIDRIKHASREELLFSGYVGCSAEVSSAKAMRSEGCLSQAWSAASFIELMHELQAEKY